METKIFPSAILSSTVEVYDSQISIRSKVIYLILLGLLLLAGASLPLIVVDVAVQTRAFQPSIQRNPVQIATGGRLESWNLSENKEVKQGEVLAVIRGEQLSLEMKALEDRLGLLQNFICL